MSADTKATLEQALSAHIADEAADHALLTDYYLIAASVGAEQDVTHYLHVSIDSGTHVLMGLVNIGRLRLNAYHADPDND